MHSADQVTGRLWLLAWPGIKRRVERRFGYDNNYLKLTLSNTTFAGWGDKKRELKRFASSFPLKDCMNFGRLFNVAAKRASKWRKLNESPTR